MTGEEFLRDWADGIVAARDVEWYQRFYTAVSVLELVNEIDIDVARKIGQDIRARLTQRGLPSPDFHLQSSLPNPDAPGRPKVALPAAAPSLSVRGSFAPLPPADGDGGPNFLSVGPERAWLICSGAGPPPWTRDRPLPFTDVIDDHARHYQLRPALTGESSHGPERLRWDLRATIEPGPPFDVVWIDLITVHGSTRAWLQPPAPATISTVAMDPPPSALETHLTATIHYQVWSYLHDPQSPHEPIGIVADALIAVGAIEATNPLVEAVHAVDAALDGSPPSAALPDALRAALTHDSRIEPWVGVTALGISLVMDNAFVTLEALVGHPDHLAVHFLEPPSRFPAQSDEISAHELLIWGTDNLGGGYAGHSEILGGATWAAAFHLRPPLNPNATQLSLQLQGPAHRSTINIDISGQQT
jgi:hypothetical protein